VIQESNECHLWVMVCAALEDLVNARLACGADARAYAWQAQRSVGFILGCLPQRLDWSAARRRAQNDEEWAP
jgi:hypothetical protein